MAGVIFDLLQTLIEKNTQSSQHKKKRRKWCISCEGHTDRSSVRLESIYVQHPEQKLTRTLFLLRTVLSKDKYARTLIGKKVLFVFKEKCDSIQSIDGRYKCDNQSTKTSYLFSRGSWYKNDVTSYQCRLSGKHVVYISLIEAQYWKCPFRYGYTISSSNSLTNRTKRIWQFFSTLTLCCSVNRVSYPNRFISALTSKLSFVMLLKIVFVFNYANDKRECQKNRLLNKCSFANWITPL